MFISKKNYNTLVEIIEEQGRQINELIGLCTDAQERTRDVTEKYCNLIRLIDENCVELPKEVYELINQIEELNKKD